MRVRFASDTKAVIHFGVISLSCNAGKFNGSCINILIYPNPRTKFSAASVENSLNKGKILMNKMN